MLINSKTFLTYSHIVKCPPSRDEQNSVESLQMAHYMPRTREGNCYLDHETEPKYRDVQRRYNFFMKMKNGIKFPNGTYPDYEIDYPIIKHYEIGKPSPQLLIILCASYFCKLLQGLLYVTIA